MADSGCLLLARTLLSFCSLQFLSFSPLILQEPLVESCTKQERELRGGKKRGRTLKAALNLLCPSSSVQFSSGWLASLYFARHRFLCSAFFFKLSSSSSSCCLRKKEPKWESDSTNKWPPVSLFLFLSLLIESGCSGQFSRLLAGLAVISLSHGSDFNASLLVACFIFISSLRQFEWRLHENTHAWLLMADNDLRTSTVTIRAQPVQQQQAAFYCSALFNQHRGGNPSRVAPSLYVRFSLLSKRDRLVCSWAVASTSTSTSTTTSNFIELFQNAINEIIISFRLIKSGRKLAFSLFVCFLCSLFLPSFHSSYYYYYSYYCFRLKLGLFLFHSTIWAFKWSAKLFVNKNERLTDYENRQRSWSKQACEWSHRFKSAIFVCLKFMFFWTLSKQPWPFAAQHWTNLTC